jgi:hypothetical protein
MLGWAYLSPIDPFLFLFMGRAQMVMVFFLWAGLGPIEMVDDASRWWRKKNFAEVREREERRLFQAWWRPAGDHTDDVLWTWWQTS